MIIIHDPPTPALAKAGAAPGTTAGVEPSVPIACLQNPTAGQFPAAPTWPQHAVFTNASLQLPQASLAAAN